MEANVETVLSVTDLTLAVKKILESKFPSVVVRGEVSNFKEQASGHLYFTLKDAQSQISAVLFRGQAQGLSRLPKLGDEVIVRGEVNVYAPRGNYQLIVRELRFAGVGELLIKLHELKSRLEARGWFDPRRKRPIPQIPKTIGVVTSPTGAVIQDILQVLNRRFSSVHLILNPVKVQGEGAAAEIARAIEQFNEHKLADVLIVGRGGGSLEDLWAFNDEVVAAAIFNSKIPVISAVGHETDVSIADYVADVRAPTPSAAAEMVIAEKAKLLEKLSQGRRRLEQTLLQLTRIYRHKLDIVIRQPLFASPYAFLEHAAQRLDDLSDEIATAMQQRVADRKTALERAQAKFGLLSPKTLMATLRQRLTQLSAHLQAIDPKQLLKKGFCIAFRESGHSVILSSAELCSDDRLKVRFHDGEVGVSVLTTGGNHDDV
jgi:exodeoxyribonuclease VII large subunit